MDIKFKKTTGCLFSVIFIFSLFCFTNSSHGDENCEKIRWEAADYPESYTPGSIRVIWAPLYISEIRFKSNDNIKTVGINSYSSETNALIQFDRNKTYYHPDTFVDGDRWSTTTIPLEEQFFVCRQYTSSNPPGEITTSLSGLAYYRASEIGASISGSSDTSALIALINAACDMIDKKCGSGERKPSTLEMDSPVETILPDAVSQAEISILVKDLFGNPMANQPVSIVFPGLGNISPSSGNTNQEGLFTAVYTSPSLDELNDEKFIDITASLGTSNLESRLRFFFDIPDNDPAMVEVSVEPDELPADGESTAQIVITLANTAGFLLSGEKISFEPPVVGTLEPLSGITREDGTFKAEYTAPAYADAQGNQHIEILAHHTETNLAGIGIIEFILASLDAAAEPAIPSLPFDTAVIPGDSRFPARYQFTLRDPGGEPLSNVELVASIEDSSMARLDGDGSSGSHVTITTDDQGKSIVEYIYLGDPPDGDEPFVDTIMVKNTALGIEKKYHVSIGLDIQVAKLTRAVDANQGNFPKTMGLRFQIKDNFHPEMNLFTYLESLNRVTARKVGINLEIQWLNKPSPRFMDNLKTFFPNLANPLEPAMYNGSGIVSIGDNALSEIIIEALDEPSREIGLHTFPAITFPAPGNFWFRTIVTPVILSENSDPVHGASIWDIGPIFSATIAEESESVLQSLACMFNPTSKQQFLANSLFLDNPLLTGLSVAGGVPFVAVAVTKAAGIICDYMQGNYFTAMANLLSMDISMRENLVEKGIWTLSESEQSQMARAHLLNFYWANWTAGNTAWNTFSAQSSRTALDINRSASDVEAALGSWPEALNFEEYLDLIAQVMAGTLASHDYFNGWDLIAVLGGGNTPVLSNGGEDMLSIQGDGITIFLCPSGVGELSLSSTKDIKIFYHHSDLDGSVIVRSYKAAGTGENTGYTLDLVNKEVLLVDHGMNGTIDVSLSSKVNTHSFLAGDINYDGQVDMKDVICALQLMSGADENAMASNSASHFADMEGDKKIGLTEAVHILQTD